MAQPRSELHTKLLAITPNVYFQPPANVMMQYPCIIYERDYALTAFGDDSPYRYTKRYQITVIDRNPDSDLPDLVSQLPMCIFNRFYASDDLNHDVFQLYF